MSDHRSERRRRPIDRYATLAAPRSQSSETGGSAVRRGLRGRAARRGAQPRLAAWASGATPPRALADPARRV